MAGTLTGRSSFRRLRSLRYRALVVVVLVVILPLGWVWTAGRLELGSLTVQRTALEGAATEAVGAWSSGGDLEGLARRHAVRLRVVAPDGTVTTDLDHSALGRMLQPVTDPFYGPEGPPDLRAFDATLPAVRDRPESAGREGEVRADCQVMDAQRLLLCAAGVRLADGSILHVERGSPRLVRSLYDQRFQLSGITLGVLGFGGLLALWIGYRMVRPIEDLRDQVVARIRDVSTEPVVLERADELGELADAFNELLSAVRTRDEANAAFAADLAHELKNPVAAVKAAVEMLAAERPVEGDRKERLVRVLGDATGRMEVVIQQFLELARAEAGLPDRERERFDLCATARHLTDAVANDPRNAGLAFAFTGSEALVLGVPERVETAIRNLLLNAAHFAGPSGRVSVAVSVGDGLGSVAVEDSGPGVPPEDLPHLFSRYRSTRVGGTGLGLPMAKAIAVAHGGRIDVATAPGGGASFTFRIPSA